MRHAAILRRLTQQGERDRGAGGEETGTGRVAGERERAPVRETSSFVPVHAMTSTTTIKNGPAIRFEQGLRTLPPLPPSITPPLIPIHEPHIHSSPPRS